MKIYVPYIYIKNTIFYILGLCYHFAPFICTGVLLHFDLQFTTKFPQNLIPLCIDVYESQTYTNKIFVLPIKSYQKMLFKSQLFINNFLSHFTTRWTTFLNATFNFGLTGKNILFVNFVCITWFIRFLRRII